MNFDYINSQLINRLEKGGLFWRKPFQRGIPRNYFTKRPYSGINNLLLCKNDYPSPFYATFLQIKQNNFKLKKGSKSDLIIFWKILEVLDEEQARKIPFLNHYNVFNTSFVEGIPQTTERINIPGQEFLSAILDKFKIRYRHTFEGEAYYNPSTDEITMPQLSSFSSSAEYLSTFFHEISHWCLNNNRTSRPALEDNSRDYGFEELIAELSACYLCGYIGIEYTFDNSAAYIDSWIKSAKLNKWFFYKASHYSQKIIKFLLPDLFDSENYPGINENSLNNQISIIQ